MQTQTPTPTPLTAIHYRVGMEVEVDTLHGKQIGTVSAINCDWIRYELSEPFGITRPHYGKVTGGSCRPGAAKPVLRPVTAVSDAEWQAFWPGCEVVRCDDESEPDGRYVDIYTTISDGSVVISLWPDGDIGCRESNGYYARLFKIADLTDYLDQIGADARGWLLDNRAVLKAA